MIVVNRHGLYGLNASHINFVSRVIKYALLAMQMDDVSLLEDSEALTLRAIALDVESLRNQELKYFCIPFLSNQDITLKHTFEAALKLTLVFDKELFKEDCAVIKSFLPDFERSIQLGHLTCFPGECVKIPTQLSLV